MAGQLDKLEEGAKPQPLERSEMMDEGQARWLGLMAVTAVLVWWIAKALATVA